MLRDSLRLAQLLLIALLCVLMPTAIVAQEAEPDNGATTSDELAPPVEAAPEQEPEEASAEEAVAEPGPAVPVPAEDAPAEEMPVEEAPVEEAPVEEAPVEESPVEEAPAEVMPAEPAPGDVLPQEPAEPAPASEAQAAFDAHLAQWKGLLKELRQMRADFRNAEPEQVEPMRRQWDEKIAEGEELIAQLRRSGMALYAAEPDANSELTELLIAMVVDGVARDDYEPAAEVAETLLDGGFDNPRLLEPAGMAMLATNRFDKAEEYLQAAQEAGALGFTSQRYLSDLPEYKEFWKTEQQLRAEEAEADDLPRVRLSTTAGEMVIELLENEAPETVGNFVSLVESGFYNGLTFHRVLPAFMAQGGCPLGDGTDGPGYMIYCESHLENHRKHFRGSLSMAHAGRDTGGSQFFLTFLPTPHLNGRHTVFGRVIEGLDVLAKIERVDPQGEGPSGEPDRILEATVLRKRDHAYEPNKVE